MHGDDIVIPAGGLHGIDHRLQTRLAAADEQHTIAGRLLDRGQERLGNRDHDARNIRHQKALDDVLHERLSREGLELLGDRPAETRARTCSRDDDKNAQLSVFRPP